MKEKEKQIKTTKIINVCENKFLDEPKKNINEIWSMLVKLLKKLNWKSIWSNLISIGKLLKEIKWINDRELGWKFNERFSIEIKLLIYLVLLNSEQFEIRIWWKLDILVVVCLSNSAKTWKWLFEIDFPFIEKLNCSEELVNGWIENGP